MYNRGRLLAVLALFASCELRGASAKNAYDGHLVWGPCVLRQDPDRANGIWPVVCVQGRVSQQWTLRSERKEFNASYSYGELYLGLHFNRFISFHGRTNQRMLDDLEDAEVKETETAFVQFGNPALHRVRVVAGLVNSGFGVNRRPLLEVYDDLIKSMLYWRSPPYGLRLIFSDLVSNDVEISFNTDKRFFKKLEKKDDGAIEESVKPNVVSSLRYISDIAALGGTRFILSLQEERRKERKLGAAILNRDSTSGLTGFEWVRVYDLFLGDRVPFRQLMRFTYEGDEEARGHWLFEYEDELRRYWLTTLGYEYEFFSYLKLRSNVSYYRARLKEEISHWMFAGGIEAHL